MRRDPLTLLLILLIGLNQAFAEPIRFSAVEASNGPASLPQEATQILNDPTRGWTISGAETQAAVFRPQSPLQKGALRLWLTLFRKQHNVLSDEFTISVTSDANPSLASRWDPVFPITILTDQGDLSRSGYQLKIAGESIKPLIRIDGIIPYDATALKIELKPLNSQKPPLVLANLRATSPTIMSSNIALGCPVIASHEVEPGLHPLFLTDGQKGTYASPAKPHPPGQFYFELDLGRVVTLDHISLIGRDKGDTMRGLSMIHLELFETKPEADSTPVWTVRHRSDGTNPEPGAADIIRAPKGQGTFRGRYLRISSDSPVALSPQIAEVEVYESLVHSAVNVTANGRQLPSGESLRIPSSANWLTFTLVPPSLPGGIRIGAQAKIEGADNRWHPVGSTEKFEYHKLPPGEYIFEGQMVHTDGELNDAILRTPLVVVAPWWKQPIAQLGAALLAVALGALVTRQIVQRRLKRQVVELERRQELSNERRRIARDMHDVVGARLTQLTVMHELYAEQNDLPAEARSKLQTLTATAKEAISSLDETVWAINPRNDTLQGLVDYLCHTASTYLQPLGITCRQDVQDDWPEIPVGAQKRHGLLHAFKEALQNVVKHANATEVTLTLRLMDHSLFVAVADNGRGLPPDLSGMEKDGLENMSTRLAELGGTCQVRAGTPSGTLVEMRLAL